MPEREPETRPAGVTRLHATETEIRPAGPSSAGAPRAAVPPAPAPRPGANAELRHGIAVLLLMITDWATVAATLSAIWHLREEVLPRALPQLHPLLLSVGQYFTTLYYLLPWTIAFAEAEFYSGRVLFWEEARRALRACTLAAIFATLVAFATKESTRLSRLVLVLTWLATIVLVPVVRHTVKKLLAGVGLWRRRVLILGAGETGAKVYERLMRHPVLGYEPVAFVDDEPARAKTHDTGLPVMGPLADVPRFVREFAACEVLLAMPRLPRERLLKIIGLCEGHVTSIRLVPDTFGLATVGVETEDLDGILLLHMRWNLAKPWNLAIKRVFDLVTAAVGGVVLLPLLALAALAVRLDSRGRVFFRQERVGQGWRRFSCIKFRTMYEDAAERLERHLAASPAAREEWETFAKLKSRDPRVTRVGRVLRRYSLDELPQLLNVFRGEMSLVGPRPYLPNETPAMGELGETIVKAPPGITGLWQVSGRSELPFQQRVRLDEYYVRNWSLWLDVIVLLKTAGVVLMRRGAY